MALQEFISKFYDKGGPAFLNRFEVMIISPFEANPNIADDFTGVVFQIATGYEKSALDILEEMKGQDGVSVNATIAYYLNGLRSKATLLGVTNVQQPNIYAARNVQV